MTQNNNKTRLGLKLPMFKLKTYFSFLALISIPAMAYLGISTLISNSSSANAAPGDSMSISHITSDEGPAGGGYRGYYSW